MFKPCARAGCNERVASLAARRPQRYCSKGCKQKAYRARKKFSPDAIAARHAILPELIARHFERWQDKDEGPIRRAYDFMPDTKLDWWARKTRESDGYVMAAYPPPDLGLPPIAAQLSPDNPLTMSVGKWEFHSNTRLPKGIRPVRPEWFELHGAKVWYSPLDGERVRWTSFGGRQRSGHIDRKRKKKLAGERLCFIVDGGHGGTNVPFVHRHHDPAKYVYPRKARKQPTCSYEPRRINMYPESAERLATAKMIAFLMEGKKKHLSALSEIIEHDLPVATCDVGSVTLWGCPDQELERVAARHFGGKLVVLIPDADARENSEVMQQAWLLHRRISRLGLTVVIALPTMGKGEDDHRVAGGRLGDLIVLHREAPNRGHVIARLEQAGVPASRRDRLAETLETLAFFAFAREKRGLTDGRVRPAIPTLSTIAREAMGVHHSRVIRDVAALKKFGLIKISKPLTTQISEFSGWVEWRGKSPTITFPDDLRATDLDTQPLKEYALMHGISLGANMNEQVIKIQHDVHVTVDIVDRRPQPGAPVPIRVRDTELAEALNLWQTEQGSAA